MRALWLVALCACGFPEQLLRVTGAVEVYPPDSGITLTLQADEGATPEGCGNTFGVLREVTAQPRYSLDVLRAEVIGPRGTPRCFRVDFDGGAGSHSQLTFGPLDHDVTLPTFHVWPNGDSFGHGLREDDGRVISGPLFDSYVGSTSNTVDLLPVRSFFDVVDDRGQRAWRLEVLPSVSDLHTLVTPQMLEDRDGGVQAIGFRVGRQFDFDPLGRSVELHFEYRARSNRVPVHVSRQLPVSRGAPCGVAGVCPFTDGDFTPAEVDAGSVSLELDAGYFVRTILVRGLWVERGFARLQLEIESDAGTTLVDVPVPEQTLALARDGVLGDPRLDLQVFTGRVIERLSMSVVDDADAGVTINRLAELSLFE